MNNLRVFDFCSAPVRVIRQNGEPWFVARDVCAVLGLDVNSGARDLPEDEVSNLHSTQIRNGSNVGTTDISIPNRGLQIVNEPGLYRLVFRSRKPEAEKFKRWVFHDVLPAIRKNGYFSPEEDKFVQELKASAVKTLVALDGRIAAGEALDDKTAEYVYRLQTFVFGNTVPVSPEEEKEFDKNEKYVLRFLRRQPDGIAARSTVLRNSHVTAEILEKIEQRLVEARKISVFLAPGGHYQQARMYRALDGVVDVEKLPPVEIPAVAETE